MTAPDSQQITAFFDRVAPTGTRWTTSVEVASIGIFAAWGRVP